MNIDKGPTAVVRTSLNQLGQTFSHSPPVIGLHCTHCIHCTTLYILIIDGHLLQCILWGVVVISTSDDKFAVLLDTTCAPAVSYIVSILSLVFILYLYCLVM